MMNLASNIVDAAFGSVPTSTPPHPVTDNSKTIHALVWNGKSDVRYVEKPMPCITDQRDIILKITACSICGSDLHLYSGAMMCMQSGDILGHEFMGIVHQKGSEVKKIEVGQRVVVAFDIACGECEYCLREEYTACQTTNPSKLMEESYGHRTAAIYGYSHLTGGIPGGQSEFTRVPFADVNCLVVPDDVTDEKALYLSDLVPTAYHGTELGNVKKGDVVGIWGLGPIGLMTARWCQIRGASRIIGIDWVPERLRLAKDVLGIEIINLKENGGTLKQLKQLTPRGLDIGIECAGFEYAATMKHKVEMMLGLETDSADIISEMIFSVRPCGVVVLIGVYAGYCNHYPIGAQMEKDLVMKGGQSPTQKYWKMALEMIQKGEIDPEIVITHRASLADGPELYKNFYDKKDGVIKVFLRPNHTNI